VAAPVQRTPGRRPVPVAVDTHRLRQGLRRIPIVQTPTFWTPTAVPETAADSQGVRGVRFCSHPGHRPRCPAGGAGRRRTRSRRCGATAGPRMSDCSSALVKWQGWTQPAENGCPDARTPDAAWPNTGSPHAPGTTDTRGSGHAASPRSSSRS
jgi:hypothetical protein